MRTSIASKWVSSLRIELADDALQVGLQDVDASVLQRAAPRTITQKASRNIYERGFDGIYYRSRYGHDLEKLALFEPFKLDEKQSEPTIFPDDRDWARHYRFSVSPYLRDDYLDEFPSTAKEIAYPCGRPPDFETSSEK